MVVSVEVPHEPSDGKILLGRADSKLPVYYWLTVRELGLTNSRM